MTTIEYDLDTSGGLMEQIQKLVAPPVSEEYARRLRRREREHRRHGRSINHDSCDSCREGGDLLCCDRCPAAFHLQCHDPPLEEDDLPPGEWICHRCRVTPSENKDDAVPSTSSGQRGRPKRQHSRDEEKEKDESPEHPLQTLAKAARFMNPVQFDLTKDITCNVPLPGSSKRRIGTRGPTRKLPHELDNGMVPLPAKVCFQCGRSCRVAPLIQCDYCPLLYHMDCLDPPLTSLPTGRWMCPTHVEHSIDEHLTKSLSLSERVKLWDQSINHVDQHAVKIKFLQQGHRKHPLFRIKRRLPSRKTITVPQAIKDHYINPPQLLPRAASSTIPRSESPSQQPSTSTETTLEEQEEWLSAVVSLQTSIARYLAQKQLQKPSSDSAKSDCKNEHGKPTASVAPVHRDSESAVCPQAAGDSQAVFKDLDCDRTSNYNGSGLSSPQDTLPNGPFEVGKGAAISLLHGNSSGSNSSSSGASTSAVNGEVEFMEVQRSKPDAVVIRTRSNSADSASPNVVKVTWPCGDKQPAATATNAQGKNILISAINKVSKVLPNSSQGGKVVLPANMAAKNISGSNPTSILSPRVTVQPAVKIATPGCKSTSTQPTGSTQTPKVITVSASPSGGKSVSSGVVAQTKGSNSSALSSLPTIINVNSTLQQLIEGNQEMDLNKVDEKLIHVLAWQRLQQLMSSNKSQSPANKKSLLNGLLSQPGPSDVRARAVLCPLTGKGQAVAMPYRSLSIGTGADMDVSLSQFGNCNFVSPKHACIFYDEMTRHYELLNYSEHGTTVDNVLYSCDFSDKPATTPQPSPVVAAVREINSRAKRESTPKDKEEKITMSARSIDSPRPCNCRVSSSSLIGGSGAGWEGTALLHHGSYIKVGCLQFVFSIVDQASSEPIVEKRESMSLLKTHLKAATTQ